MSKINSPLPEQQVKPEAALERRTRRIFTADYKLKIIQKADLCQQGELGELLRKDRLYHSQLSDWRKEFELKGLSGLNKSAPGPKSKLTPEQKRIVQLEKENLKLKKQLQLKDDYLALQKKALGMLESLENETNAS